MKLSSASGNSKLRRLAAYALPLFIYVISAFLVQHGYGDWDAVHYTNAALDLIEHGLLIGDKHWDLRYPLVLPITASMALFGTNELSAALPNILYGAGLVLISTGFGIALMGRTAGILLGVIVAVSPPLTLLPVEIEIRGPETFFVVLSLWLVLSGTRGLPSTPKLVGAGVAAGLAILCREVAAYALPTVMVGAFFMVPKGQRMRAALLPLLGFVGVLALELLWYLAMTGDPFYRYIMSLSHRDIAGGRTPSLDIEAAQSLARGIQNDKFFGTLSDPFWQYLTSIKVTGAIPILGILAAVVVLLSPRPLPGASRSVLMVFSGAAVVSYGLATLVLNLDDPRYFPMLDYLSCLLVALALAQFGFKGWRKITLVPLAALALFMPFMVDSDREFEVDLARLTAEAAKQEREPLVIARRWYRERAVSFLRLEGWTSEEAEAEFVLEEDATQDTLYMFPVPHGSCRWNPDTCEFEVVRELGIPSYSWGQQIRSTACEYVPALRPHVCLWIRPVAVLYRKHGAEIKN